MQFLRYISTNVWRLILFSTCFVFIISDIVMLKYVNSEVAAILGLFTVLGVCIGAIFVLPCHPAEKLWCHSEWQCYPRDNYDYGNTITIV